MTTRRTTLQPIECSCDVIEERQQPLAPHEPPEPQLDPIRTKDPSAILREDSAAITDALRQGVRDALRRHAERGEWVAIARDGKVVRVRAAELIEP